MRIVEAKKVDRSAAGDWYLAVIVSETEPTSGSITGADVDGCAADDRFAAGSVIMTPSANWVAFVDGEFSLKA